MYLQGTLSNAWRYFWLLGLRMLLALSGWRPEVLLTPHNGQHSPRAKPYPANVSIVLTKNPALTTYSPKAPNKTYPSLPLITSLLICPLLTHLFLHPLSHLQSYNIWEYRNEEGRAPGLGNPVLDREVRATRAASVCFLSITSSNLITTDEKVLW